MQYELKPRLNILLIKKHKNTALHQDIAIEELDNDKALITAEVIKGNEDYPDGTGIVIGKYAIFKLVLKGEDYYFCHIDDVISTTSYKEE